MQKICSVATAMFGLSLTLGVAPSWAQRPPTNDVSDTMANTGGGTSALINIKTGGANTAYGNLVLQNNSTGGGNTAMGFDALGSTNGNENTAVGAGALTFSDSGDNNTAVGSGALEINSTGSNNTAIGANALANETSGSNNIAVGLDAGAKLTAGSNNIYLGANSLASESNTMRLGQDQTHAFVAGIAGHPLIGSQVVVTAAGQLGVVASSARFKRDIQTMGEGSQGLFQLRPVTFRYKQDLKGIRQYGLIAEEVAKVYPELVTRGPDGKVASVQYHELIPMLLNELQRQQRKFQELKAGLTARLTQLETAVPRSASLASR